MLRCANAPITAWSRRIHAPIHGIFPADAELDHTLGLLSLHQASELHIYGTTPSAYFCFLNVEYCRHWKAIPRCVGMKFDRASASG